MIVHAEPPGHAAAVNNRLRAGAPWPRATGSRAERPRAPGNLRACDRRAPARHRRADGRSARGVRRRASRRLRSCSSTMGRVEAAGAGATTVAGAPLATGAGAGAWSFTSCSAGSGPQGRSENSTSPGDVQVNTTRRHVRGESRAGTGSSTTAPPPPVGVRATAASTGDGPSSSVAAAITGAIRDCGSWQLRQPRVDAHDDHPRWRGFDRRARAVRGQCVFVRSARDYARGQARPTLESVGEWKYWLSSENSSISRRNSARRASAVPTGKAIFAARVATRLSRVEPVLHGAGEQAVGDVPEVGLVVVVGDLVAEVDGATEGFFERMGFVLGFGGHGRIWCDGRIRDHIKSVGSTPRPMRQNRLQISDFCASDPGLGQRVDQCANRARHAGVLRLEPHGGSLEHFARAPVRPRT